MTKKKLPIWDQRMLQFIKYCVDNNLQGVKDEYDFIAMIGIDHYAKLTQVRLGAQSFTWQQLYKTAEVFGISMDYFAGFTNNMYRDNQKVNPVELLQYATKLVSEKYQPLTIPLTKSIKKAHINKK